MASGAIMGCGGRSHKLGFLLSLQSGGGLAVVQLRGGAWVRNKLRGGAGLRRSEAEWLPAGLAVGQDVVAGGCVAVNGG
uniref:Uncharacterized protein n=1 Tax=Fagus sylvatica TaxID=28930 RepID=A0A2N9FFX5_FAGSY